MRFDIFLHIGSYIKINGIDGDGTMFPAWESLS